MRCDRGGQTTVHGSAARQPDTAAQPVRSAPPRPEVRGRGPGRAGPRHEAGSKPYDPRTCCPCLLSTRSTHSRASSESEASLVTAIGYGLTTFDAFFASNVLTSSPADCASVTYTRDRKSVV